MHASEVRVLAQNCLLAAGYGAAMMSSLVEVSGHPNVWRARIDDGTRALGSQVIVKRGGHTLDGVAAQSPSPRQRWGCDERVSVMVPLVRVRGP